jgi:hypothetical protein
MTEHMPKIEPYVLNRARYKLFEKRAFNDQREYYSRRVSEYRRAGRHVNRWRAIMAFLAGLASALEVLLISEKNLPDGWCHVSGTGDLCTTISHIVIWLPLFAIIFPAIAAALNVLSELYQWDRLATIYGGALENLEVVDAESPLDEMNPKDYEKWLKVYALDALSVMSDEAGQWGQVVRTPKELEDFLAAEVANAHNITSPPTPPPSPHAPG